MPAGRPPILTPAVLEDFRRVLPTCMYKETVADYLGISRRTLGSWLKRGAREARRLAREPDAESPPFDALCLELLHVLKKGLAEADIYDLGVIKKAAADHWQAAAWRQERRHPERWGSDKAQIRRLEKQLAELEKALGKTTADVE